MATFEYWDFDYNIQCHCCVAPCWIDLSIDKFADTRSKQDYKIQHQIYHRIHYLTYMIWSPQQCASARIERYMSLTQDFTKFYECTEKRVWSVQRNATRFVNMTICADRLLEISCYDVKEIKKTYTILLNLHHTKLKQANKSFETVHIYIVFILVFRVKLVVLVICKLLSKICITIQLKKIESKQCIY